MTEIRKNVPLANFTRFQAGGAAEFFFEPESVGELASFLRSNSGPVHVLGLGSNVLVRDGVVKGTTIRLARLAGIGSQGGDIVAEAGVPDSLLATKAPGFEFLACIPGSIGAALLTNAGCFGREVRDIVISADLMDVADGRIRTFLKDELGLGYRSSKIPKGAIVIRVRLRGGGKGESIADMLKKKNAVQPTGAKTAGSVFKNPPGRSAWRLVADAGMQGARLGGAEVSRLHANFIVNLGGATSADIAALMALVQERVRERFGVELEPEIRFLP
ncbi:MAG: UDP-N-acetylmuramate dehydrogenase [Rickettsiales bacterium]|jgi:UDP-N-acetylmuramate dehydrogenase|nr:UDP-N-acetylmuramate dehydrogenase [Rickettsiales bacterium]